MGDGHGQWLAGWAACKAQMIRATMAHAQMVSAKGGGTREGAAAMVAVLWLADLMEKAQPTPGLDATSGAEKNDG